MINLNGKLANSIQAKWDEMLLVNYNGTSYSGHDVAKTIERIRILLDKTGIGKNDNVAICGRNSAEWCMAFLASHVFGATTVTILPDYTIEGITAILSHSESKVIFTDADLWARMDPSQFRNLRCVVSLKDFAPIWASERFCGIDGISIDAEFNERHPWGVRKFDVAYPMTESDHISIINYTSGTTSSPKGVMISEESIISNIDYALCKIPVNDGDNIVSMLPMAHMFGLMFEFLYPLCGGATVFFIGKIPSPSYLLSAMNDIRPYIMITVPLVIEKIIQNGVIPVVAKTYMKVLLKLPYIKQRVLGIIGRKIMEKLGGKVTQIIMGGAAMSPAAESWCRKLSIPYTVGYGMTESSPLISFESSERYVQHSCGRVVDRMQVRIDSIDSKNVPGEIEIKGVNVMRGYFRNQEETQKAFTEDGWLRTGDLGVIDDDGNIFIRGRKKSMILSGNGQNIYPEEVEAVINSIPPVLESLVVSRNSKIVALIVLTPEAMASGAQHDIVGRIIGEANRHLPSYSRISYGEVYSKPFEKTPKMSIRRYLYA